MGLGFNLSGALGTIAELPTNWDDCRAEKDKEDEHRRTDRGDDLRRRRANGRYAGSDRPGLVLTLTGEGSHCVAE